MSVRIKKHSKIACNGQDEAGGRKRRHGQDCYNRWNC